MIFKLLKIQLLLFVTVFAAAESEKKEAIQKGHPEGTASFFLLYNIHPGRSPRGSGFFIVDFRFMVYNLIIVQTSAQPGLDPKERRLNQKKCRGERNGAHPA